MQSANLCWLIGPLRRGARLEEIGQIGLKPALLTILVANEIAEQLYQIVNFSNIMFRV